MMRGLHKATGYWQTQAAKADWTAMAEFAANSGLEDKVKELSPPENWGWRRIDKRIAKLRKVLRASGLDFVLPSAL